MHDSSRISLGVADDRRTGMDLGEHVCVRVPREPRRGNPPIRDKASRGSEQAAASGGEFVVVAGRKVRLGFSSGASLCYPRDQKHCVRGSSALSELRCIYYARPMPFVTGSHDFKDAFFQSNAFSKANFAQIAGDGRLSRGRATLASRPNSLRLLAFERELKLD